MTAKGFSHQTADLKVRLKKLLVSNSQYLSSVLHGPSARVRGRRLICVVGRVDGKGRIISQGVGQGQKNLKILTGKEGRACEKAAAEMELKGSFK